MTSSFVFQGLAHGELESFSASNIRHLRATHHFCRLIAG
jgi:hypothetical protein